MFVSRCGFIFIVHLRETELKQTPQRLKHRVEMKEERKQAAVDGGSAKPGSLLDQDITAHHSMWNIS